MTSSVRLTAYDAVLGRAYRGALGAGRPAPAVVLAVLAARGETPPATVRLWLRRRGDDAVKAIANDAGAWRALATAAKQRADAPIGAVRLKIARRSVASLLLGLPAGEAALSAVIALSMLDSEEQWDTAQVTKKLGVILNTAHSTTQARVRSLTTKHSVLTLLSKGRGVPGRVRFATISRERGMLFDQYPAARALVTALVNDDRDDEAVKLFRAVAAPAIGYGDMLDDASWHLALLTLLDASETISTGRRARASRTLRAAGVTAATFAAEAERLSLGEPTRLHDEKEAERVAEAEERAASAAAAREMKTRLYRVTLPKLAESCGAIPTKPDTERKQAHAKRWIGKMHTACAPALGTAHEAPLRSALRQGLVRRGWTTQSANGAVAAILPEGESS